MENNNNRVLNIAASWPAIVGNVVVNEQALESTQILPQLLHEASEEAQQQQLMHKQQSDEFNWAVGRNCNNIDENDNNDREDEEQLQSMLENYQKHVIKQKQRQSKKGGAGTAGRSASHLQKRINASQPVPMSHSQPCLLSSSVSQSLHKSDAAKSGGMSDKHQKQQLAQFSVQTATGPATVNGTNDALQRSSVDARETIGNQHQQQQPPPTSIYSECNGNGSENLNEINQLRAQNEKLRKQCERLEELEKACKRIERDYDQVTTQHERREELQKVAMQKLEQHLRMLSVENEQLRAQNARLCTIFGVVGRENGGDSEQQQMQFHFLLNELIPKNEELLLVQERQRIELDAQSATLEEQRTHIEVLEKALSNAQERLAAKERSAVDAVAVVDKCSHLQRMLQEALEDKQRQKLEHGRQVAQLEMELTQLRLQFAKDTNPSAIGSIGRKSGGAMASATAESGMGDEMLKLRKTISLKDDRISQLESGLLEMQKRYNDELKLRESTSLGGGLLVGIKSGGKLAELESLAMRLEQEKFEKERRVHELLDEKCHIQMQWNEERRSLDYRVRLLEKDLRHFMGSQSSLASSSGGGGVFGGAGLSAGLISPYGGAGGELFSNSPFGSMRGQNLRHRSSAELPTSARVAALYEERSPGGGLDVITRMEGLGRRMAERRAQLIAEKSVGIVGGAKLSNIARPSDIALSQPSPNVEHQQPLQDLCNVPSFQHPSLPSRSSSTDQTPHPPLLLVDLSPSSEEPSQKLANAATPNEGDCNAMPQQLRQPPLSTASSASSSTKKRYYVGAATAANYSPLNVTYLEQISDPTRRRQTGGERMGAGAVGGGFTPLGSVVSTGGQSVGVDHHQNQEKTTEQHTKEDAGIANGGGVVGSAGKPLLTRLGPPNRRGEGGCRRLIRDHSIDARRGESRAEQQQMMQLQQTGSGPVLPPNYREAQQRQPFRRELGAPPPVPPMLNELPPPAYQQQQQQLPPPPYATQMRQMLQMSSIEEPMLDPVQHPPPTQNYAGGGVGRTVVEVKGEEGDSDTLNSHRQLVYRRSSLGNANAIK